MLRAELLELVTHGENSGVEFKRDDVRPEQLAKEIVAMANFRGGSILLGVEDDGSISGIQRPNLEEWVMDTVFGQYVHPSILPFYEEIQVDEQHRVAVVTITQGTTKPYVLRNKGREEVYIRVGSTSRLASREQQARLFAQGGMLHAELLPVSGSSLKDLSRERLSDYLVNIRHEPEPPTTDDQWLSRLMGLGFLAERDGGAPTCTIAGLLLFGYQPRRLLRQAGIRWMAFDGIDKSYQALDDAALDGPLVALGQMRESGRWESVENGLIENLIERMRPFISEESAEVGESMRRERVWHYPIEALREAIVNAVVHRDWTRSVDIEVVRYQDRLEVVSPGAMQNSMTVEKMVAGQRSPRNPILVEVLRDYGYVDARGMGVRTKIIPLLKAQNGVAPVFTATEDFLGVVMPRGGVAT